MSSPVEVQDSNQFDVLRSPVEGKQDEGLRSRFSKDDIKEQAFQAREAIKTRALDLKEMVVSKTSGLAQSDVVKSVSTQIQSGIDFAKEKVGIAKDTSNEDAAVQLQEKAEGEWQEVKHKGRAQVKKAKEVVDDKLDENLTSKQRQQLNKAALKAKKGAVQLERQAEGFSNTLINNTLRGPQLRPLKMFIQKNNLQLPVVILGSLLTLWLGLTMIRMVTMITSPKVPEFDIHSKEATMDWVKYHAGEYKDKAIDMRSSLTGRAAAFLANHEFDKLKNSAIDWKEVGIRKLGLQEPTWGEWAWAKITGRPITWQDRVTSVLDLAKDGISRVDLKSAGLFAGIKNYLHPEPTMADRAAGAYDYVKTHMPGQREPEGVVDGLKHRLQDGIDNIRSHLPGGESIEAARQRAYEATHPSTLDQIRSGANYIKNRVIHGAQEAGHIAQDRANELADKAKLKTGL